MAITLAALGGVLLAAAGWLPSHPAESHECGMENSDHPQSRQTRTSGEGVKGGWLSVRGLLRYSRTSAGKSFSALDWHFMQIMSVPLGRYRGGPPTQIYGVDSLYADCTRFSTKKNISTEGIFGATISPETGETFITHQKKPLQQGIWLGIRSNQAA